MMTKRELLALGSGAALLLGASGSVFARSQLAVGTARLDVVSDGELSLPGSFLFQGLPEDELAPILRRYGVSREQATPPCNLTLLRDGERTVLFDVGGGANFMPGTGKVVEALEAIGVDVSDITDVVFTHAHPDHLWGVLDDFDDPLFPEARYHIARAEWDYWTDPDTVNTIGEARQAFAAGALRYLGAIEDATTRFDVGAEILPGVQAYATHGHTPGHTSFQVGSGTDAVMVVGDAIGNHHIAFERPDWEVFSDQDKAAGAAARVALLDRLASEKMRLIGYHLPFPGAGFAERKDGAYRFVPSS